IFAPSTVCYNWENEIEESTNKSVIVLDSKKLNKFFKEKKIPDRDFYVIPYSVPSSWGRKDNKTEWLMKEFLKKGIKFVVADEAHNLQQLSTKKAKFIKELAQKSGAKFYLLTGTIYTTDPYTSYYLYSLSNLGRRMFMNRKTFVERYAKTKEIKKENKTIKVPYGSRNERELQATLRRFLMVKRDRDTILKGLPAVRDLIIRKEWNDPKKKSTYDFLVNSFKETGGDPSLFPEMRKMIAEDKIEDLIERLKDIEETWKDGTNQGKVLVFAHYQDTQKLIRETLQKKFKDFETVALYSDLNDSQRKEVLERFKNDDRVKVLVASLSMAKEGLNLTEATEAIFYELPFTYNDFEQAKARIYRIGQEHPVTFTVLLKRDSYDIDLWKKIKRREANFKNAVSFLQAVLLGNGSFKPKK
ncbi:DEAD/DEAH box helicase, partial [Desulfurobacterium sp.]|uniref:helicase-related protein n=1 Tax=Desulfurobacterium sp. TaxID=2004706 RepID=UPI0026292968